MAQPNDNLVSVIIPAYNAENYVLEAIKSVLIQNYAPVEILLIDDGSTDRTVERVQIAAPEVRIIRQQNAGVAAARNTGLREARGRYVTFLDADDGWFPGKLSAQTRYLQSHPEVGLVFHSWKVWKPDSDGVYRWPQVDPIKPEMEQSVEPDLAGWLYLPLLLDCEIHTSTVMIRHEIINKVGFFDTDLVIGEDYDYWLRISRVCEMHKLSEIYSFYRSVEGSLSNKPKLINYEYEVINRALLKWGPVSPDGQIVPYGRIVRRLAGLAFSYGYYHYHQGMPALALSAFTRALHHDPLNWRAIIYWVLSWLRCYRENP